MSEASKAPRRVSEVVEKGVEGLYDFLFRLLNTLWTVTARPKQAVSVMTIDRHRARGRFVYPLTYAAVGVFLVSLVAGVAGPNILDWIWLYGEIWGNVAAKLNAGVSLVTIAIGSIPAFLLMLFLAGLYGLLIPRAQHRFQRSIYITCYAVGAQCAYVFMLAVVVSAAQLVPDRFPRVFTGHSWPDALFGGATSAAAFILAVAAVVVPIRFILASFRIPNLGRRSLALLGIGVISTAGLLSFPVFASLPAWALDAAKPADKPVVEVVSDVTVTPEADGLDLAVDVVLNNKSSAPVGFATNTIRGTLRVGKEPLEKDPQAALALDLLKAENEAGAPVAFASIEPKGLVWRRLRFRGSGARVYAKVIPVGASRCIEIHFGLGSDEVQSPCVRTSFTPANPTQTGLPQALPRARRRLGAAAG